MNPILADPENSWYTDQPLQPWEIIRANGLDFFEGSALKYLLRWRRKNGLEDLLKARVYLNELIEQEQARLAAAGAGR